MKPHVPLALLASPSHALQLLHVCSQSIRIEAAVARNLREPCGKLEGRSLSRPFCVRHPTGLILSLLKGAANFLCSRHKRRWQCRHPCQLQT